MEKEKRILKWTLPILAILLPVNLMIGVWKNSQDKSEADAQLRKFNAVVNTIRDHYVDGNPEKIGYPKLVDGALEGMLQNLDRHSHYLDKDAYSKAQERLAGEFAGIGITYTQGDGEFTVHNVLPGGPAAKAGLKPDDKIVLVDGEELLGKDPKLATKLLKGEKDTPVKLGISRGSENLEIELIRDIIKMPSITGVRVLPGDLLYMHISQFNSRTDSELKKELGKFPQAKGLIMDLRHNPGGLLVSAQQVCSYFLSPITPNGKRRTVVSIIPRDSNQATIRYVVPGKVQYLKLPIVILVNGQSASAAEIVAGCLKDYNRAKLVGTRTFGKGSVQQERPLGDGTAIRITTAKYYTPSRTVIHERGIDPHIEIPLTPEQLRTALSQIGSKLPAKELLENDPQLNKAFTLLGGNTP